MYILGHSEAENLLASSDRNRSQSFLLEGLRGIGKAAVALKYAGQVLGNAEKVKNCSHPDFLLIERRFDEKTEKYKKEITVDDARQLGEFLRLTPAESTHRVAIVDSADELNTQAANALLKLVEEPPKRSVIILLSHGGHVLPTIRSRCISIRLKPLSKADMRQVMGQTIPNISEQDMDLLAIISEGSPGIAKEIYDNDGLWLIAELMEIVQEFPQTDYSRFVKFAERATKANNGWDIFCHLYEWVLTSLAKAAARGEIFALAHMEISVPVNLPLLLDEIARWRNTRAETEIFNLDNKQVIVNELMKISAVFGSK